MQHEVSATDSDTLGHARCCFGLFELDLENGELRRGGQPVALRHQAATVLRLLVRAQGRLVEYEALKKGLWGSRAVEWETGLHQVVRQLRKALDDNARVPVYIQTVPKRGYRFVAPVKIIPSIGRTGPRGSAFRDLTFWALGMISLPVALILVCLLLKN